MYVIGTAGHVDHGKSTLVKTLTGIDPDRLAEEQRREMTIDLGFAWMTLPSGRSVSIVDVPGHERFIKNMLAGVGGLDAALLVVAADESVMPQTEEHLAILDLLELRAGLVVITKRDLVDAEWLALVEEELDERLRATVLASAARVAVSAHTGAGLPELRAALDRMLDQVPSRSLAAGVARLPIDRSFTVDGFGTVVTGTLLDGPLALGQDVVIQPGDLPARVRGLQTHRQKVERALPGTRVAVNLAGIHHQAIRRGMVLAMPGRLAATRLLDVQLRVVPHAPRAIELNTTLDLFTGAAEVVCRATPLDRARIAPGEQGWVQLRLEQPVVAVRGDRLIVRQSSPSVTIGGGVVVDAHPLRHRRFRGSVIARLEALARGTPADLVRQVLVERSALEWGAVVELSGLPEQLAQEGLAELLASGAACVLACGPGGEPQVVASSAAWEHLANQLATQLERYHTRYPLRQGMPRADLRSRLGLEARVYEAVVRAAAAAGQIATNEATVRLSRFQPRPTTAQQARIDQVLVALRAAPYAPPAIELDPELATYLFEQRVLIRVAGDVYYLAAIYDELLQWVQETILATGSVSVAQLRDRFGTSRKYALALLEHFDERNVTRRVGDARVLAS